MVTSRACGGKGGSADISLRRCLVSRIKDGIFVTRGLSFVSTKALILSVGHPFELTIGRPGGEVRDLWILGSR